MDRPGDRHGHRRQHPPLLFPLVLHPIVVLLLIANVINLGADIGAMGIALKLLIGGPALLYSVGFGIVSAIAAVLIPYRQYSQILKWAALVLLVYVATAFVAHVHWLPALAATFIPHVSLSSGYMSALMAVFGTTISPYLFFWQASQEVEEQEAGRAKNRSSGPQRRRRHSSRGCAQAPTWAWDFQTS